MSVVKHTGVLTLGMLILAGSAGGQPCRARA